MEEANKKVRIIDAPKNTARWGQDRRLAFIDFRLRWEGRINRADLTNFFSISVPQASLDIARYTELAPQNLSYDRSSRVYLATPDFRPLSFETHSGKYLNELLAVETGVLAPESSYIGLPPVTGSVPHLGRAVDSQTLAVLLKAIRDFSGLRILYQSMSKPEPSERIISPHAFGYDGFRWHVRAFCHTRNEYLDFVMGRILENLGLEPNFTTVGEDIDWNTLVTLEIAPNPNLAPTAQRAIELDYGMNNGRLELTCRRALLFYTLKRLGLNQPGVDSESQHIILLNHDAIAEHFPSNTSTQ
jgi:predicted DNA-binding transcriptional regulator YafY